MRCFLVLFVLLALGDVVAAGQSKVLVTPETALYRERIDKALLESGLSVQVSIAAKDPSAPMPPGSSVPYPALIFVGYIDRAMTYLITTKLLNSFAEARSLGLKTVEFYNKGGGKYSFDLRKPSPTCSRDLCF